MFVLVVVIVVVFVVVVVVGWVVAEVTVKSSKALAAMSWVASMIKHVSTALKKHANQVFSRILKCVKQILGKIGSITSVIFSRYYFKFFF